MNVPPDAFFFPLQVVRLRTRSAMAAQKAAGSSIFPVIFSIQVVTGCLLFPVKVSQNLRLDLGVHPLGSFFHFLPFAFEGFFLGGMGSPQH